jgi:hypothetical protein
MLFLGKKRGSSYVGGRNAHIENSNFNHERWTMCCGSARAQRYIVEECLKYIFLLDLVYQILTYMVEIDGLASAKHLENHSVHRPSFVRNLRR